MNHYRPVKPVFDIHVNGQKYNSTVCRPLRNGGIDLETVEIQSNRVKDRFRRKNNGATYLETVRRNGQMLAQPVADQCGPLKTNHTVLKNGEKFTDRQETSS